VVRELILSLDAMGGDAGPAAVLAGAAIARRRHPKVRFLLHGDERLLRPLFAATGFSPNARRSATRRRGAHVGETEPGAPSRAVTRACGMRSRSVAKREADVAVSSGNTGALMAFSMFRLDVIEGIHAPR
jgi:glycerol-3-phosphate acyltransferase PlsX